MEKVSPVIEKGVKATLSKNTDCLEFIKIISVTNEESNSITKLAQNTLFNVMYPARAYNRTVCSVYKGFLHVAYAQICYLIHRVSCSSSKTFETSTACRGLL